MRRLPSLSLLLLVALPAACFAQQGRVKLPDFTNLAKRATESVVVTLDRNMLKTAAQFMNPKDGDSAAANAAISGLDGVYVRSFTFAHDHEYARADVDSILKQLDGSCWSPMVNVHETNTGEDVRIEVCLVNGHSQGMVIVAAEPRELTIVNLVGNIDLSKLGQLGGRFGVPNLPLAHDGGPSGPKLAPKRTAPAAPSAPSAPSAGPQ
jgi:hypothetical protein